MLLLKISPVPPNTFASLVYFSRGTVSKPPELLCTPTCDWSVFPQDNATIVWLWALPPKPWLTSGWRNWATLLPSGYCPALVTPVVLAFLFL